MKFLNKEWQGTNYKLYVQTDKDSLWIHYQGQTWLWKNQKTGPKKQKKESQNQGLIASTLPGRIQKLFVQKGDRVKKGDNLLILSAMKIEYNFKAEGYGTVESIFCRLGQAVDSETELIKIKYDK